MCDKTHCMYEFRNKYGYHCSLVPIEYELPDGLELKPETKH